MHDDEAVQTAKQKVAGWSGIRIAGKETVNAHPLLGAKRPD